MPAGSDEYDNHPAGSITEQIAKDPSSKTESTTASSHPAHNNPEPKGEQVKIQHHQANPGPAIPKDFQVQQEGTKEDRVKRAAELNK